MVLGRQGPLAKMLTGSIGMTQEYQAHRKTQKEAGAGKEAAGASSECLEPPNSDAESEYEDDEAWARDLDAAQAEHTSHEQPDDGNATVADIANTFTGSPRLLTRPRNQNL